MDKTMILKRQKTSSEKISTYEGKPDIKFEPYEVGEIVLQEGFLGKAIAECLIMTQRVYWKLLIYLSIY